MIFVQRPAAPPAEVAQALAKLVKKLGKTEIELAREYYAQNPPPKKAYPFARYKEEEVCLWLDRLYHEKCAYCESIYRAVDSRDIEHFRPKAGVTEAPGHPGYWWLAADWSNLLPSCPPCNQLRHQTIFDIGMTLEELEKARLKAPAGRGGKANAFPMRPPANWVTAEAGDLGQEDPLLIHPSMRDPSQHLQWVFDWKKDGAYVWEGDPLLVAVRPRQIAGGDDPYGTASIGVYGLNRSGLVRERMARAKLMQAAAQIVVRTLEDLAEAAAARAAVLQARLRQDRAALLGFTARDQPYAGMAKAFVELFDVELTRRASDAI